MSTINELLTRKEELNPILQLCLVDGPFGMSIEHPLIKEIFYNEQFNALYNEQFKRKTEELKKCLDEKNYHSYIFWHERPYRLQAFTKIMSLMEPATYWELLRDVWIDSENIFQNFKLWKKLLTAKVSSKESFMNAEEKEHLASLPDVITIHRGYRTSPKGFSYTLDLAKAHWFADRFSKNGKVKTIQINKSQVFAYLKSRNEQEIIYF